MHQRYVAWTYSLVVESGTKHINDDPSINEELRLTRTNDDGSEVVNVGRIMLDRFRSPC